MTELATKFILNHSKIFFSNPNSLQLSWINYRQNTETFKFLHKLRETTSLLTQITRTSADYANSSTTRLPREIDEDPKYGNRRLSRNFLREPWEHANLVPRCFHWRKFVGPSTGNFIANKTRTPAENPPRSFSEKFLRGRNVLGRLMFLENTFGIVFELMVKDCIIYGLKGCKQVWDEII